MHLQAHRFVSSPYPPVPFSPLPALFFLLLFHPCLHLVTFLKNWQQRREIDVMKNNWDISMSHLLCRYGHPLSPQRGSRLSVAIEGILQISQQLSEVTSQMHGWPRSLPSIALLPALCPNFVSLMLGFHCPLVFIYLFVYSFAVFKIALQTHMSRSIYLLWHTFNNPGTIEFKERMRWKFRIPNVTYVNIIQNCICTDKWLQILQVRIG